MQLTLHTDYALRVLIYLTLQPEKIVTIDEITDFYEISRNHLVKVVHNLSNKGFISTSRGKHGGMQLSRSPEEISIGDVVRQIEANFDIVECFNPDSKKCRVVPICNLKSVLQQANENFLSFLDQYSLAEAIKPNSQLKRMFSNIYT
jgi:Rrf2 family nitric oxide-sensitive transcriptional repressor